ncbi:YhdP family protein [Vibrio sp. 99-8-1]|uniref:YhdP family protein n=1 Tax=Vibrio sp. 99-8-1 TaxID=2607602 RepID=UPI001493DC85|nr:TIGR02099 family protein [Vibrio sp. 99-8-1]
MTSLFARIGRIALLVLVTVMVILALAVTALRVTLPRLDNYQNEITSWVVESTGLPFSIGSVNGYWRNTRPSISLQNVEIQNISDANITFYVDEVQIQVDLIQSLLTLSPQVASLNAKGLSLDISAVSLLDGKQPRSDSVTSKNSVITQLERLFLWQLKDFNLQSSTITYQTFQNEIRSLNIEQLKWHNQQNRHQIEGDVSLVGSEFNSLAVMANFEDYGSILDVSGDFYAQGRNISVAPWLTKYLEDETGIESGQVSFNSWFSVTRSEPVDAYLEILPSELMWNQQGSHLLVVEKGIFKLIPGEKDKEWKVSGHSIVARTDNIEWPSVDLAVEWSPELWTVNVSQLNIDALRPLAHLIPESETIDEWLTRLQPSGDIEDIRVSQNSSSGELNYSAKVTSAGIKQWYLLPEVHDLTANITGNRRMMVANATLVDDVLPYGDVFQAPLKIKQGEVNFVWENDDAGWRLWSDKVAVTTPDLQALGEFKLDFPNQGSPFLSIYAEADAFNVGETWRYLPTLALGQDLTDYLSTAIQGGKAKTAQILWYGEVGQFPYQNNNGVFQAKVGLKNAKFSFDTRWPTIKELQLDLLFENASLYMDSRHAKLLDVEADRITGQIAYLGSGGAVEITAKAVAKGDLVRDYMMATPLVDSVGAALTTVQVSGDVSSQFQLNIPFDQSIETRAWGYADLPGNHIEIQSPPIQLDNAKGRILFDNDVIQSSGLTADLLEQAIAVDFQGESLEKDYTVAINVKGDWDVGLLEPYIGSKWTNKVQGHAPWRTDVDLQLSDTGFTYQVESQANLEFVSSQYPAPLTKALGEKSELKLQASGNQQNISSRLQLPNVKYQAEIDISNKQPVLTDTYLLVGNGGFKVSPVVGHQFSVRAAEFNLDNWLAMTAEQKQTENRSKLNDIVTPDIPFPQRISIATDILTLGSLDWHNVDFSARKKNLSWVMSLDSSEAKGKANYLEPYDLSVSLERLQIFVPALDNEKEDAIIFKAEEDQPLITEFDREFHQLMPNITLNIQDFWLQGYKVGKVNVEMERKGEQLQWRDISISSGNNKIQANGSWTLSGEKSNSQFDMFIKGDNNSELMDRFGISSGIQKAPFEVTSKLNWHGSPWSMQIETLQGTLDASFGKGVISDVSGAAKLLGMFSLDSIIRKMKLDFSDVFDKGLAFDSITGSGKITNGVFVTNNFEMDAIAGDMMLKGLANLNNRTVDAEVEFTPDLTSGIPVLTAFAVTPQTAVVVFAISAVISPVVDVFTKVRYQIQGSLDAPEVKELSRSKGEYQLSE